MGIELGTGNDSIAVSPNQQIGKRQGYTSKEENGKEAGDGLVLVRSRHEPGNSKGISGQFIRTSVELNKAWVLFLHPSARGRIELLIAKLGLD